MVGHFASPLRVGWRTRERLVIRFSLVSFSLVISMLLAACGTTPQSQRYLLPQTTLEAVPNAGQGDIRVVIGQVEVAPFLAGAGIVQLQSDMTIHHAHYHRWAEPLPSQLERQLRTGLQQQLPDWSWLPLQGSAHLRSLDYRLDVTIDSFHLNAQSEAIVAGQWQLRDGQQGYVAHGDFAHHQALQADGYGALVSALHMAWQQSLQQLGTDLMASLDGASAALGQAASRDE